MELLEVFTIFVFLTKENSFAMKRLLILAMGLLALVSCGHDFDFDNSELVKSNAEKRFGTIDPNQDWNSINSGSIVVTADASLENIVKVQILTESPFFNDQAKILAETSANKGDVVTVKYDAPVDLKRLIAACVDDKGNYFIKGFNTNETKVSFKSAAATRGFGMTRAASDMPDFSLIEVDYSKSFPSYNALRASSDDAAFSAWKGKNWENERLWRATGPESTGGWTIKNSAIYRDAAPLADDDKATLEDIFRASLYRDDPNGYKGRRDNLDLIRKGNAVKFFSNHLVSNGKAPIVLSPIQMASTEAYMCDIYYYYYKVEDVPAGMSETDYIKTLPKYKAIDLNDERQAFKAVTGISESVRDENFLRLHEYLLPYYGELSDYEPIDQMLSHNGYKTDAKLYRIHNVSENKNNYFTYGDTKNNLKDAYTENVEQQLWQIFTNDSDPDNVKVMLYNVYAKQFLYYNNGGTLKDIDTKDLSKFNYHICEPNGTQTSRRTDIYIFTNDMNNCIKSVSGNCLGNGGKTQGPTRVWSFEEYTGSAAVAITDFALPAKYFPAIYQSKSPNASATIPDGYRIGFMIRKDNGRETGDIGNSRYGCMYGCGELNTEINTFGQFNSSITLYGMELNDPRMATFTANGKTYLCFEEGADTQYSDVILEIGGVTTTQVKKALAQEPDNSYQQTVFSAYGANDSGIYMYEDLAESMTMPMAFTMCFEDRPINADYDLNDIVLRCTRVDATTLSLALIACGANDDVVIHGAEGWELNDKEAHEIFHATSTAADGNRFVNTKNGGTFRDIQSRFVTVDKSLSIPDYLKNIYIENRSTGGEIIGVSTKGIPPCAIIIPDDFQYCLEGTSITTAYREFVNWAQNYTQSKDWYRWGDASKYYDTSKLIKKIQ